MTGRAERAMLASFSGGNVTALAGFILAFLGSPLWRPVFYAGCAGLLCSAVLGAFGELRDWRTKRRAK